MGVYRRGDSKKWWISYSVNGRLFREVGGTTKAQAHALLAKRRVEMFEGRHFPEKKRADLTVGDLRDKWLAHAEGKRSLAADKQRFDTLVKHLGAHTQIAALFAEDIDTLKRTLQKTITRRGTPMAPSTVNRHLALLRSALRYASKNGYHHRDPMAAVTFLAERNERNRICHPEEYAELVSCAERDPELHLAIVMGYHTGMRLGEIANLQWDQVNLRARLIRLRGTDTKTDEGRDIPISSELHAVLKDMPRQLSGDVFKAPMDKLSKQFANLCRDLEIQDLRFHDLRHTAATRLRRSGVDLLTIQRITGHKSLQMLKRYNTIDTDDLLEAMAKVEEREGR